MGRWVAVCLFIVLSAIGHAQAETYSWTDDKGVRHFSDTPVPGLSPVDVKIHGRIWTNSIGMEFVYLEPGTLIMGLDDRKAHYDPRAPAHKVTLTKGFQIQVTEVTNEQWRQVMPKTGSRKKQQVPTITQNNMPVCNVSRLKAQIFVAQLNKLHDGGRYQIPTEAQWEYACRAGQTSDYNWGSDMAYPNQANYKQFKSGKRPMLKPVGSYAANRWHIYDMHGNVSEWCQKVSYRIAVDPKPILQTLYESSSHISDSNAYKIPVRTEPKLILRGGSYKSPPYACRSGVRFLMGGIYGGCHIGLRVIRFPEN